MPYDSRPPTLPTVTVAQPVAAMPTMTCPRCGTVVLDEHVREGITIDACRQCRGIWLDRGELERLIAYAMNEQPVVAPRPSRSQWHPETDDDDRYRSPERRWREPREWDGHRAPPPNASYAPKRKRWFEILKDILD